MCPIKSTPSRGVFIAFLLLAASATAPQAEGLAKPKKLGLGIQATPFPIFGPSVAYNLNEAISLQVVGRAFVDVDFVAGRFVYRFKNAPQYNLYGYGLAGVFRDDEVSEGIFGSDTTDTAPGFGVGGGAEYFFSGLPWIGWRLEAGFLYVDFEPKWWKYDYESFTLVMVGAGIHYWF